MRHHSPIIILPGRAPLPQMITFEAELLMELWLDDTSMKKQSHFTEALSLWSVVVMIEGG